VTARHGRAGAPADACVTSAATDWAAERHGRALTEEDVRAKNAACRSERGSPERAKGNWHHAVGAACNAWIGCSSLSC